MDDPLNPSSPSGKSRKYALLERERRFLLARRPDEPIARTTVITDNYLVGTRLRLRRAVETADGSATTIYKLTQKVPALDGSPGLITTLYLTQNEYDVLAVIPMRQLTKTRLSMPPFGVDIFNAPLDGLVMAETEFTCADASRAFPIPAFAVAEVTADVRFTGGRLVTTTREELVQVLEDFGIRLPA
jgi:CYTH domain-containing protein